jgi:hypothetical protein
MGILEDGLARIEQRRSQRIQAESQNAKRSPYQLATYQGKSLIDGSDIVKVGSDDPVSGFKLVSNASLGIGDKVSLRPNNAGGLQRVDARNVAPLEDLAVTGDDFVGASLVVVGFLKVVDLGFIGAAFESTLTLENGFVQYLYYKKGFKFKKKTTFNLNKAVGSTTSAISYVFSFDATKIYLNMTVGSGSITESIGQIKLIVAKPFNADFVEGAVSLESSPIEFDLSFSNTSFTAGQVSFFMIPATNLWQVTAQIGFSGVSPSTETFSFRWRKRGTTQWFSLA